MASKYRLENSQIYIEGTDVPHDAFILEDVEWGLHGEQSRSAMTGQVTGQATDQADALLKFCEVPRSVKEIMQHLGMSHRPHFCDSLLRLLTASGKLAPTIPDKPSSPNQRYITVKPEVD